MFNTLQSPSRVIVALMPLLFLAQPVSAADNNTVSDVTVSISESNPVGDIYHTDDYDNTLQATVSGTPTPEKECTIISGPDFTWSPVSSPYTMPTSGSSVDLHGSAPATQGWPANVNTAASVSVTASWTDDAGNTYTTKPASDTPRFFSKWPQSVDAILHDEHRVGPEETGIFKEPYWGHASIYAMIVYDNDQPAALYGRGVLNEAFSNTQINPLYANDLRAQGGVAEAHSGPLTDPNQVGFTFDTIQTNNSGWTNPPTSDTGDGTLWFQTVQSLDVSETWARGFTDTPLGSYTLYVKQGETLRVKNVR